ncbi:MAG: gramicidin synthase [Verrucomicrobiales bacterium]|nr:gramicidin synthase [Verrucomicrobiales bacterium]
MSKAFTREDDTVEESILPRPVSPLPPGVKNYMTPDGAKRLQEELKQLTDVERPRVAALVDPTGPRRELVALDQRIVYLGESLQTAVIVQPPTTPDEQVRFGATVTVRDKSGIESKYRLVGIDETDMDRNWISWRSPIARALLNTRVGQRVRFRLPTGEEQLEIVALMYEP